PFRYTTLFRSQAASGAGQPLQCVHGRVVDSAAGGERLVVVTGQHVVPHAHLHRIGILWGLLSGFAAAMLRGAVRVRFPCLGRRQSSAGRKWRLSQAPVFPAVLRVRDGVSGHTREPDFAGLLTPRGFVVRRVSRRSWSDLVGDLVPQRNRLRVGDTAEGTPPSVPSATPADSPAPFSVWRTL